MAFLAKLFGKKKDNTPAEEALVEEEGFTPEEPLDEEEGSTPEEEAAAEKAEMAAYLADKNPEFHKTEE